MNEEVFIRNKFREYYSNNKIEGPRDISAREFGFGSWKKKIETRHYSFSDNRALNAFLVRNVPFFISYSIAFYRYPSARPMEKKEWLWGELVFDIDANELEFPCTDKHGKEWVCEKCMEGTKESVFRLIDDFLTRDFAVDEREIEVNFSGNRGYHVHLMAGYESIGGYARKEIADYVNGTGLDYDHLFEKVGEKVVGPKLGDGGWKGRIAKTFVRLARERKLDKLISKRVASKFYDDDIIREIANGNWERVYISNRKKFFTGVIEKIRRMYGCYVDEQVTMDTSKLIRLPDSIHGGTGMIAMRIKDIDSFDPFSDPVIFGKNEMKVFVEKSPEFILKGETYGPFENEEVVLPEYAAIYLICKGVAKLIDRF